MEHGHAAEAFYISGYALEMLLKSLYVAADLEYPKTHNFLELKRNFPERKKFSQSNLLYTCFLHVDHSFISKKKWAPELRYTNNFVLSSDDSNILKKELKYIGILAANVKHSFRGREKCKNQ